MLPFGFCGVRHHLGHRFLKGSHQIHPPNTKFSCDSGGYTGSSYFTLILSLLKLIKAYLILFCVYFALMLRLCCVFVAYVALMLRLFCADIAPV